MKLCILYEDLLDLRYAAAEMIVNHLEEHGFQAHIQRYTTQAISHHKGLDYSQKPIVRVFPREARFTLSDTPNTKTIKILIDFPEIFVMGRRFQRFDMADPNYLEDLIHFIESKSQWDIVF